MQNTNEKESWEVSKNKIGTENKPDWADELKEIKESGLYSELFCFVYKLLSNQRSEIVEIIQNFNPNYGELGVVIPDFKERLLALLNSKDN